MGACASSTGAGETANEGLPATPSALHGADGKIDTITMAAAVDINFLRRTGFKTQLDRQYTRIQHTNTSTCLSVKIFPGTRLLDIPKLLSTLSTHRRAVATIAIDYSLDRLTKELPEYYG
jgi:hypothetical protein